jgi:hypothetical protein
MPTLETQEINSPRKRGNSTFEVGALKAELCSEKVRGLRSRMEE